MLQQLSTSLAASSVECVYRLLIEKSPLFIVFTLNASIGEHRAYYYLLSKYCLVTALSALRYYMCVECKLVSIEMSTLETPNYNFRLDTPVKLNHKEK